MTTDGKWMCSSNEEYWTDGEEFDTREQALAYAQEFAVDYGVEPGCRVFVGQVKAITVDDLLEAASLDAGHVVENIDMWLYDRIGDEVQNELVVSKEQLADLDTRLAACVKQWLVDHEIEAPCFRIANTTSVVVEQRGGGTT